MSKLLGPQKVARLRRETGLDIVKVIVTSNHVQQLCLEDGRMINRWPNGSLYESPHKWRYDLEVPRER